MNLYDATIPVFTQMLHNVGRWLDKTAEFATAKKFDPDTLLTARLAPDMLAFARQIMLTCDHAKNTVARLAGKEPKAFADDQKTIAELRARITATIEYLGTFKPEDFNGAEEREAKNPRWQKSLRGKEYLTLYALPNFYFHATTTYNILRHNGVDVGKNDFVGELPFPS